MNFIYILLINIFFIIFSFQISAKDCSKPTMPSLDEWNVWLSKVKEEAVSLGISLETIEKELNNIKPQEKIIMRDRCQPESTITLNEYLYYRVDKARIVIGKNMLKQYKDYLEIGQPPFTGDDS